MINRSLRAEIDRYLERFLVPEELLSLHQNRTAADTESRKGVRENAFRLLSTLRKQEVEGLSDRACEVSGDDLCEASCEASPAPPPSPSAKREEISCAVKQERRLEDLVGQLEETFSERLLRLIREKDLDETEVYKGAFLDRRHFSKIRNDRNYAASKKTVLALALSMHLTLDETRDLLNAGGYALSRSSGSDMILQYFFENRIYDIFLINDVLYEYGQPVFE